MKQVSSLELMNRSRAERPLIVVLTRRRSSSSEDALRVVNSFLRSTAAVELDAVAFDVDEPDHQPALAELGVRTVPEIVVLQRGVVVERAAGAVDGAAVASLVRGALHRRARA